MSPYTGGGLFTVPVIDNSYNDDKLKIRICRVIGATGTTTNATFWIEFTFQTHFNDIESIQIDRLITTKTDDQKEAATAVKYKQ